VAFDTLVVNQTVGLTVNRRSAQLDLALCTIMGLAPNRRQSIVIPVATMNDNEQLTKYISGAAKTFWRENRPRLRKTIYPSKLYTDGEESKMMMCGGRMGS
jgi:hypothetical protein